MEKLVIGLEFAPSHSFGRAIIDGVSAYAAKRKCWKLQALSQESVSADTFRCCDGVIMRVLSDRIERLAREAGTPLVDIYCGKLRAGVGQITSDEAASGNLAADFLLSRGFTNFAYCGISNLIYSNVCLQAFRETLAKNGFAVHTYENPSSVHRKNAFDTRAPAHVPDAATLRKWIHRLPKPVAIFCCNDQRAYQVMTTALKSGFGIPQDIALLGVDNDSMLCSFAEVPLSSIDPNAWKLGYSSARLLDAMMRRAPVSRRHRLFTVPPKGLVERASTEHAAFNPPWLSKAVIEIERHLTDGITANQVFALSGHSAPHVEKIFREQFGLSVQAYITSQRMNKARALLKNSDLSVKEVAFECGYATPQYFCNVFRKTYGTSTRSWLRKNP